MVGSFGSSAAADTVCSDSAISASWFPRIRCIWLGYFTSPTAPRLKGAELFACCTFFQSSSDLAFSENRRQTVSSEKAPRSSVDLNDLTEQTTEGSLNGDQHTACGQHNATECNVVQHVWCWGLGSRLRNRPGRDSPLSPQHVEECTLQWPCLVCLSMPQYASVCLSNQQCHRCHHPRGPCT